MVVGYMDAPPARRRWPGSGDIASKAHEHASAGDIVHGAAGAIGRPRLGCGTQVELHPTGHSDGGVVAVELDRLPSRLHAGKYLGYLWYRPICPT